MQRAKAGWERDFPARWSPAVLRHGTRGGWETLPRGTLTPGLPVVLTSVSGATSHVSCVGSKELASSSPLACPRSAASQVFTPLLLELGDFREDGGHRACSQPRGMCSKKEKTPKLFTEASGFVPMEGVQCCTPPALLRDMGFSSSTGSLDVTSVPVLCTLVLGCGTRV